MSGGGVTPFSPTPWIFDTGESPQTMGQNCVAGTTEFDEENGIGLVMYVESGSNMIVWKMSDGTKQGTTVPVSSEYKNMLRTAFENKTGTRIGYFVFHPYTEESINIESSITINSGDTPYQTQYYKYTTEVPGKYYIFAKNTSKNANVIVSDETSSVIVVDKSGVIITISAGVPDDAYLIWMKNMFERNGISIDTAGVESTDLTVGDTIPNWDEYVLLKIR